MVSSRDSLIYELNDRVAVFEEDKVVLKAALRQLQKEMKDEAPKTQQLVSDLEAAKEGMYCDVYIMVIDSFFFPFFLFSFIKRLKNIGIF